MAAADSRSFRRLLAVVGTAGLLLTGTAPAHASTYWQGSPPGGYVALGDSYASGEGLPPYETQADGTVDPCHRSLTQSYPERLEESGPRRFDQLTSAACTGATTGVVTVFEAPVLTQGTRTVTLTVGGNDVGFAQVVASCLSSPDPQVNQTLPAHVCQGYDASVDAAIDYLGSAGPGPSRSGPRMPLWVTIGAIAARSPQAEILVSGYPQLFGRPVADCQVSTTPPVFVAAGDVAWIREETAALNAAIRTGVELARANGVRARYVDATATFAGHGLCDRRSPWINGLLLAPTTPPTPDVASFHPTARGQWAYAEAFLLSSRRRG